MRTINASGPPFKKVGRQERPLDKAVLKGPVERPVCEDLRGRLNRAATVRERSWLQGRLNRAATACPL